MAKRKKTERVEFLVTPQEKEMYRRAGFISSSGDFEEMSEIVRTGGTITAKSIIGIASGEFTVDEAVERYREVLLSMIPEDILKAAQAQPHHDVQAFKVDWPESKSNKPDDKDEKGE